MLLQQLVLPASFVASMRRAGWCFVGHTVHWVGYFVAAPTESFQDDSDSSIEFERFKQFHVVHAQKHAQVHVAEGNVIGCVIRSCVV